MGGPRGRPCRPERRRNAQITVVFPDEGDLERLEGVARRRRLAVSSLMRMWVMEQVAREEQVSTGGG